MADADDKPIHRRRFFRAALGELIKPLSRAAGPLERVIQQLGQLDAGMPAASATPSIPPINTTPVRRTSLTVWLRPPGAREEPDFINACSRCGECVRVCPVQAIKLEPDGRGDGFPFIVPSEAACTLCDGLLCMHSCPTNALIPTPREDIHMGTAGWREQWCVRSQGDNCTICVDHCPVGSKAIELIDGRIAVHSAGCTGCGVCEQDCPTSPKSIKVLPAAGK